MESGGGPNNDPNHVHGLFCGCAEEFKTQDPYGKDLYELINHEGIQCYNERVTGSIRETVRPLDKKMDIKNPCLRSGYGKDMVIVIPFTCEVRLKSICIMTPPGDGEAPIKMRLYKNEEAVDINIQEDK